MENSSKDGNTRPFDLPIEKPVCRSGSSSENWTWYNRVILNKKGVHQSCILSPCLFNLYAIHHENAGLEEEQVGFKIANRNINNLRCADDTTLMAESEEELKNLLMKVKDEGENVGFISTFRKLTSWPQVSSLHGK